MRTTTLFSTQAEAINFYRERGWQIMVSKLAAVTFAVERNGDRINLKAWTGKTAVKTSFYYTFSTAARAEKYAADFVQTIKARQERKAREAAEKSAARAALKASDHWTVGDTVYTSWGYDQTNVEYYQVTRVLARSVAVRQIAANSSDHGQAGGGKIAPRRYEFVGPEFLCPLSEYGHFSAGPCYNKETPSFRHQVTKWDGKAKYTSSDR